MVTRHDDAGGCSAGLLGQGRCWGGCRGHDDEVGRDLRPSFSCTARTRPCSLPSRAVLPPARNAGPVFQVCASRLPATESSWRSINRVGMMWMTVTVHAQHQAIGGFEANRLPPMTTACLYQLGRLDHGVGVGDVAEGDHAGQLLARHGQDEGLEPVAISSRS